MTEEMKLEEFVELEEFDNDGMGPGSGEQNARNDAKEEYENEICVSEVSAAMSSLLDRRRSLLGFLSAIYAFTSYDGVIFPFSDDITPFPNPTGCFLSTLFREVIWVLLLTSEAIFLLCIPCLFLFHQSSQAGG